jgi:thiosulfate/3-mercaptopyruvate sulfurtransferase
MTFVGKKLISTLLLPALVVALSANIGMAQKADCPEKIKEIIAINFAREIASGGYKSVTVDELKKWVDEKKDLLIVDTMPLEASYRKQHVPGAVPMEFPIPEMKEMDDTKKAEFVKLLGPNKDRTLVFYCGFTECTRSHNAAMWAVNLGYKNVYRFPGGIEGWVQAGYPADKGK